LSLAARKEMYRCTVAYLLLITTVKKLYVPVSGQVTGEEEARNIMEVARSQHYGGGIWTDRFERGFAQYMGARHAILCNSGSSALLLALSALEMPKGSKVLTPAVGFPTTVNAIIQRGCIPVFVDSDPKTLNIKPDVEVDFSIRAVVVAHTLGNPADLRGLVPHGIPIIEDACDAIGSTIHGRMVGRVGVLSTASFYPAHHITMGEGGAVMTDSPKLKKIVESYRDWGRDCWCPPGCDNTCGTRFDNGLDHKYLYTRIGYNLKASDLQAAAGVAQLDRLEGFHAKRRENYRYLYDALKDLPIEIVEATPGSDPSWFGFPFLTEHRNELARYLDKAGVGSRPVMGGNLVRQPAYRSVEYEVRGNLDGANRVYESGIWIGVFPGITPDMRDYQIEVVRKFYNG
jgi:CDP-4-dehydro-6-deoxyglucose reductase, E1